MTNPRFALALACLGAAACSSSPALLPDGGRFPLPDSGLLPDGGALPDAGQWTDGGLLPDGGWPPACHAWVPGPSLNVERAHPALVQLPNGDWLVAGGWTNSGTTLAAERLDQATLSWVDAGTLPVGTTTIGQEYPFYSWPAGAFGFGRAVVIGFSDDTAGMWDPVEGWVDAGFGQQMFPTAVTLLDGRPLFLGGEREGGNFVYGTTTYDPSALFGWGTAGSLQDSRYDQEAVVLGTGEVLVTSGYINGAGVLVPSSELLFPDAGVAAYTQGPHFVRDQATLTRLADGRVLAAGGISLLTLFDDANGASGPRTSSAELYDPTTGLWQDTAFLHDARSGHSALLLSDGRVMVSGGFGADGGPLSSVELFDPSTQTWSLGTPLQDARALHFAVQLADGSLLVAGGIDDAGVTPSTERTNVGGLCGPGSCVPQNDEAFCFHHGAACGALTAADDCGATRTADCGGCDLPDSGGGGGIANRCGSMGASGFTTEVVDSAQTRPSIVLDANGVPSIAYNGSRPVQGSPTGILLAQRTATGWSIRKASQTGLGKLVLDHGGNPFLVGSTAGGLAFLHWAPPVWTFENIPTNAPLNPTLATDGQGAFFVCYADVPGTLISGTLQCAYRTSSGWTTEQVDQPGISTPSAAVDPASGTVHVAYDDVNLHHLSHAHRSNGTWTVESVDGIESAYESIALDGSGNPHIAYYDFNAMHLKHAWRSGTGWSTETVDSNGDVGQQAALALTSQGDPRIAYFDYTNQRLKFAAKSSGHWTVSVADPAIGNMTFISIAVDASGRSHVAYYDQADLVLRYGLSP